MTPKELDEILISLYNDEYTGKEYFTLCTYLLTKLSICLGKFPATVEGKLTEVTDE